MTNGKPGRGAAAAGGGKRPRKQPRLCARARARALLPGAFSYDITIFAIFAINIVSVSFHGPAGPVAGSREPSPMI